MIEIKSGNLFSAPSGLICHQVNCKGVMGRGVAVTFKQMFPESYDHYFYCCQTMEPYDLLGHIAIKKEKDYITVCMFAQEGFSRNPNICNTEYWAFREYCSHIADYLYIHKATDTIINMPYGIGCGLGGGDWQHIYSIIEEELADFHVILWKLEE